MNGSSGIQALAEALSKGASIEPLIPQCFSLVEKADGAAKKQMLKELNALLEDYAPERAAPAAILAGAVIEMGGDPKDFPPAVFDTLAEMLEDIPPEVERPEGEDDDETQEDALPEAYYLYERAAMACLSRSVELRRTLPQKALLRSHIKRYSERYGFLGKMLAVLDDAPLWVVCAETGRVWRFRIGGIADNFQLHTLLLGALCGPLSSQIPGTAPSRDLVEQSRGGQSRGGTITSTWQLTHWQGLKLGDKISDHASNATWIWNEGFPEEVELFEDKRVVVIAPSKIERSWNAGRIFSGMPGRLEPEGQLSEADAKAFVARLRA